MKIEHGFVIRKNDGYFEINDIGDWSLTGDDGSASLYTDREDAEQIINDYLLSDCKIIEVHRLIVVWPHPLTNKQINKLREFVK